MTARKMENFKTTQAEFIKPIEVKSYSNSKGFTLIELSIVLLITGIISIPLLNLYSNYLKEEKIKITKENIDKVSIGISLSSPIRYPCPSNRALPQTNPNYGEDVCAIAGFTLAGVPNCVAGAEQGICKAPGLRDTVEDPDNIIGNNNEFVLIGGIPLKIGGTAIAGISGGDAVDGWGNRLSYATSFTSSRFNRTEGFTRFKSGVVTAVDEWGNNTAGSNGDGHFIIYSHGQNGSGAYTYAGVRGNCVVGTAEGENCDGDSTFSIALSQYGGTMQYDDYAFLQTENSSNLWQVVTDPGSGNSPTSHIASIPIGKIGINMTNPGLAPPAGIDVRLDVNGNIRASSIRSKEICQRNGTNCLFVDDSREFFSQRNPTVNIINDCADGEVITSIGNSRVTCTKAAVQFQGAQILCPATTWVEQILTNGSIRCTGGITCPGGPGCL